MTLQEFMTSHREEILEHCEARVRQELLDAPEVDRDVRLFFDEVLQALRHHQGVSSTASPLPGRSESAARLGQCPQQAGIDPAKVPGIFGALTRAIGSVGERHQLTIGAEEYQLFNQCIDAGIAISIENFWSGENERRQRHLHERFGHLSHELRIALGNAGMAFKLLRAGDLPLRGRTGDVLASNLVRMETLVARILGSLQLESEIPVQARTLRVATLLRQLQASTIPDRAISVTLELDESLHVHADEMLLTSAVSNLLNNAIKFSCSGARVGLGCRAEDTGVVIEVEDECGGLPEDSPLLDLGGDPPSVHFGVGLGIALRAVASMAGRLCVENVPGHGCVFRLALPPAPRSPSSVPPPARQ